MSFRTILVGIIAAVCGIFATAGFMMLKQPKVSSGSVKHTVVVAKSSLDLGQQIGAEMLTTREWHAPDAPSGTFDNPAAAVGKYVASPITAGDLVTNKKLTSVPTGLQMGEGMRAFSIEARSVSTTVGRNLIPGNRVDIIWQTNNKLDLKMDPVSLILLQNVKILAVGTSGSGAADNRSITLEVLPQMAVDLAYSQAFGTLSLSLRGPGDNDGVDPIESVNFTNLLAKRQQESEQPAKASAFEKMLQVFSSRLDSMETQLTAKKEPEVRPGKAAFERIGKGMRAITIQTPTESSGVAGLLVPGDRVDLQLTLTNQSKLLELVTYDGRPSSLPTENLIENIEVLAVDTQLQEIDNDGKKAMSRSVTLIVCDGMQADIARAQSLGTLTLVLRGRDDRIDGPPQTILKLDDFVMRYLPHAREVKREALTTTIRTYRGQAVNEIPYTLSYQP